MSTTILTTVALATVIVLGTGMFVWWGQVAHAPTEPAASESVSSSTFAPQPTPAATANDDLTSGNSRFSQGSCQADSDCVVAGCSGEVCAAADIADQIFTTCEFSEDFPNQTTHACGCVNTACAWTVR